MTDEDASALFDKLANLRVLTKEDGAQVYMKKTVYGMFMFFTDPERLRELMGDIILDFLWQMQYGFPLTPEAVKAAANIEPEADVEMIVDIDSRMAQECEQWAGHALGILQTQLSETLERTIEHHIEITMVRALLDRSGKGFYKFNVDEKKVIDRVVRDHVRAFKEGLGARRRGGSVPRMWPPERKDALLTAYEAALEMMRGAKGIYHRNRDDKQWATLVRAAYPDLPEDFINRLPGRGRDAEPNTLAKEYAAKLFGVEPSDYLEKVLIDARRARRAAADTES